MRFLIVVIIIILLVFKFWPEQPVPTAEESFIGPQLEPINKAQQVEEQMMDAFEARDEELERQTDGG